MWYANEARGPCDGITQGNLKKVVVKTTGQTLLLTVEKEEEEVTAL